DGVPVVFLVVAHEVLHHGCHTSFLDALDVRPAQLRCQIWVLGVALEVASAKWMAVDVDGGCQQYVRALRARFFGQHASDATHQIAIPGCSQRGATREAGGSATGPAVAACAVWT